MADDPFGGQLGRRIDWVAATAASQSDGHLTPAFKALVLVAAHATKGWAGRTSDEVARALQLGVEPEKLWSVAALLMSSRGLPPATLIAQALENQGVPSPTPNPPPHTLTVAEASHYLDDSADAPLVESLRPLEQYVPEALAGYLTIRNNAWSQLALPHLDVHLILTAVNAVDGKSVLAVRHADFAAREGATAGQIVEATAVTIEVGGVTAWYESAAALAEYVTSLPAR